MGQFPDKLLLEDIDGRQMRVWSRFRYFITGGELVTVAAGFVTDFATVPRLFWTLLPASGKYNRAAVIHDWLYARRRIETADGGTRKPDRSECDWIFLEALQDCGISWLRRNLMYVAVRSPAGAWVWDHGEGAPLCDRLPMAGRPGWPWRSRRARRAERESVDPVA
jgi:hypothetical protein